jgi:hypothetical protein
MDKEHQVMFEELASIRASVLNNQKILQMILLKVVPDMSIESLEKLYEADSAAFIESIKERLK